MGEHSLVYVIPSVIICYPFVMLITSVSWVSVTLSDAPLMFCMPYDDVMHSIMFVHYLEIQSIIRDSIMWLFVCIVISGLLCFINCCCSSHTETLSFTEVHDIMHYVLKHFYYLLLCYFQCFML